ncbi:hypothetical protein [Nocardioides dilutus]
MRPRTGGAHDRGAHPVSTGVWTRRLWPLLAGTVTAVGVFGAGRAYGLLGLLLAVVLLSPFAILTVWGLSDEIGIPRSGVVPIGLTATLCVLVLLGLSELLDAYGMLVFAVTGLSSPAALGLLGRLRRRHSRLRQRATPPGILLDPTHLDREFKDIVRRLDESG